MIRKRITFLAAPGLFAEYSFPTDDPESEDPIRRIVRDAICRRESFPDEARRAVAARDTAGLAGAHNDAHSAILAAPLSPPGARFIGFRVFWFRPPLALQLRQN